MRLSAAVPDLIRLAGSQFVWIMIRCRRQAIWWLKCLLACRNTDFNSRLYPTIPILTQPSMILTLKTIVKTSPTWFCAHGGNKQGRCVPNTAIGVDCNREMVKKPSTNFPITMERICKSSIHNRFECKELYQLHYRFKRSVSYWTMNIKHKYPGKTLSLASTPTRYTLYLHRTTCPFILWHSRKH